MGSFISRRQITGWMSAGLVGMAAVAMTAPAFGDEVAEAKKDAEEIVSKAVFTVDKLATHPDVGKWVRKYMADAKAVLIFPQVLKGGFIVGGEGGTGVLLARASNGEWSYPGFFSMGAGSVGLQIGAQKSELMLLVMTGKGLSAILDSKVKIGGDISGAAGPYGAGAEASTTANMNADILSYSAAEGAFIGASVEGAIIWERKLLGESYYGDGSATAKAAVIDGQFANSHADPLRERLAEFPR